MLSFHFHPIAAQGLHSFMATGSCLFSLCLSSRKQEDLVRSVRRRLEEALTADMLAHIKDTAAETAGGTEEKDEQVDKGDS